MHRQLVPVAVLIVLCGSLWAPAAPAQADLARWLDELKSATPQTRVAAADALGKLGAQAQGAVPALLEAATSGQAWIDTAMLAAIQQIGPTAEPILLDQLEHGTPEIRPRAATALWVIDGERAQILPVARKLAEDKDPRVRAMVERLIAKYEAAADAPGAGGVPRAALPSAKELPPSRSAALTGDWPEFHGVNGGRIVQRVAVQ